MSNYGPSGGPYRDQPQDPWQGRPPHEAYEQPSDPWGGQDPWGGSPSSTPPGGPGSPNPGYGAEQPTYGYGGDPGYGQQPAYGQPGYDQGYGYGGDPTYQQGGPYQGEPVWGTPAPAAPVPPPRRRGLSTGVVAFVIVLAVLAVGGAGFAAWKLRDQDGARANPGTGTSTAPTPTAEEPTADPSPTGGSPTDARFATKGQCLVNKGTNKRPEIQLVDCGKNTFEVLARYDGTADFKARCGKVKGYTDHYFYDSEVDSLDFVLCLKRRR